MFHGHLGILLVFAHRYRDSLLERYLLGEWPVAKFVMLLVFDKESTFLLHNLIRHV